MAITYLNPADSTKIPSGQAFSCTIEAVGASEVSLSVSDGQTTYVIWTLTGGFQAGYSGNASTLSGTTTLTTVRRGQGWWASPLVFTVTTTISGILSEEAWTYRVTGLATYVEGTRPYNETIEIGDGVVEKLDDIGDVSVPNPDDGDILSWNSAAGLWIPIENTGGIGSHGLGSHDDVTITNPQADEVLTWNGSAWVNQDAQPGAQNFLALDDVPYVNYTGHALKVVRVNNAEDELEFVDLLVGQGGQEVVGGFIINAGSGSPKTGSTGIASIDNTDFNIGLISVVFDSPFADANYFVQALQTTGLIARFVVAQKNTTDVVFECQNSVGTPIDITAVSAGFDIIVQDDPTLGAGGGDVFGPDGVTDNALARFDDITGKLIQGSSATLSDGGTLSTAGVVTTTNGFIAQAGGAEIAGGINITEGNLLLSGTTPAIAGAESIILSGHIDVAEVAAPATPSSGFGRIYGFTDGTLHYLNDAGDDTELGSGTASPDAITSTAVIADNALVRGDGGQRGVQDSGWTIDDSDYLQGPYITLTDGGTEATEYAEYGITPYSGRATQFTIGGGLHASPSDVDMSFMGMRSSTTGVASGDVYVIGGGGDNAAANTDGGDLHLWGGPGQAPGVQGSVKISGSSIDLTGPLTTNSTIDGVDVADLGASVGAHDDVNIGTPTVGEDGYALAWNNAAGEFTLQEVVGGATDVDAIHDNVAGEIALIAEKAAPIGSDFLLIEDSEATNAKKRIQITNLPVVPGDVETVKATALKASSGTIAKGQAVRAVGWSVGSDCITVELAQADDPANMPAYGIADEEITNVATGMVVTSGSVLNTGVAGISVGDSLYVDPATAGGLTSTRPTGSDPVQKVGICTRSTGQVNIQVVGAGRTNDLSNFEEYTQESTPAATDKLVLQKASDGSYSYVNWQDVVLSADDLAAIEGGETPSASNVFLTESAMSSIYSQINPNLTDGQLQSILVGDGAPSAAGNTVQTYSFYVDYTNKAIYQSIGTATGGDTGNGWNQLGGGGGLTPISPYSVLGNNTDTSAIPVGIASEDLAAMLDHNLLNNYEVEQHQTIFRDLSTNLNETNYPVASNSGNMFFGTDDLTWRYCDGSNWVNTGGVTVDDVTIEDNAGTLQAKAGSPLNGIALSHMRHGTPDKYIGYGPAGQPIELDGGGGGGGALGVGVWTINAVSGPGRFTPNTGTKSATTSIDIHLSSSNGPVYTAASLKQAIPPGSVVALWNPGDPTDQAVFAVTDVSGATSPITLTVEIVGSPENNNWSADTTEYAFSVQHVAGASFYETYVASQAVDNVQSFFGGFGNFAAGKYRIVFSANAVGISGGSLTLTPRQGVTTIERTYSTTTDGPVSFSCIVELASSAPINVGHIMSASGTCTLSGVDFLVEAVSTIAWP